jgi:hypothetical protein
LNRARLLYDVSTMESFGFSESVIIDFKPHYSEQVAWSGWGELQNRATSVLGGEQVPHLLAVDAWQGVFLPIVITPTEIKMGNHPSPLRCASLPMLIKELERFAEALSLPTEEEGLLQPAEKYLDDNDLVDTDMDIQTYIQLMLSAKVADLNKQPLWIVK